LFKRFGRIDIDRPLAVADNELMYRLATVNLALASPQAPEETFEVIVGAPAFGPSIASKESRPALLERRADMRHRRRIFGVRLGMVFQLGQKFFDLAFDVAASWMWLTGLLWGVQSPIQFDQPTPLTLEPAILGLEGAATLNDGQELIQDWMAPFLRLRWSEASRRARSSNTRSPPNAKGGLLPSVRVVRIRSA
jgi:hypothetical protein